MSNLEIEGLAGLAGEFDLSGNELDLDGLSGPEIANAAINGLGKLIRAKGVGAKGKRLLQQVRSSLALNRTQVQYWKAKYDQATAPSDISAALLAASEKQIVGLRAGGATE